MIILDGKALAEEIKLDLKEKVAAILASGGRAPHLAAILVGEDGASKTYVAHKVKMCNEVGYRSSLITLPADISESGLLEEVYRLNADTMIDGYIVQLPLPKHIQPDTITQAIDHRKDVDGFHPVNIGRMTQGLPSYLPATPMGIMQLLAKYNVATAGKHCVIIGRSSIVGTPMSILLSRNSDPGNCTVTMCHSRTANIKEFTLQADIIIAALGKPEFVTADMVKPGAVIIDVGITRVEDSNAKSGYKLKGDVAYNEVSTLSSFITPVPGGVGPLTVTSLMQNTLLAYNRAVYA